MDETWSTERLPESEQFEHWSEVVAQAFVPVRITREAAPESPFPSLVAAHRVGPLQIARIASGPQTVSRTASLIAEQPGDAVFLNLPLSEGSFARQDGRTAQLRPGDFAIVDATRPFELGFARTFAQISVRVPHEALRTRGVSATATATRVDGSRGLGAVASGAVRALAHDSGPLDRHTARELADHVCGLVALALGERRAPKTHPAREELLHEALDHIEQLLGDPALTPSDVATRIAVSPRHLHRLFAERDTTFGRTLLERRLAHSRAELADPGRDGCPIGEIAHQAGFADPSYFARAFKARYGVTPRQARAGAS